MGNKDKQHNPLRVAPPIDLADDTQNRAARLQSGPLDSGRRRVLQGFATVAGTLATPIGLHQIYLNATESRWDLMALIALVTAGLVGNAVWRRGPYKIRARAFSATLVMATAGGWLLAGFALEPVALHMTAVVCTAVLLGRRAGFWVFGILTVVFCVSAIGHLHGLLPSDPQITRYGTDPQNWIGGGAVLSTLTAALAMGILALVHNLDKSREKATALAERLQDEASARHEEEKERRRVETKLVELHRREAAAELAGNVAHDFNNLLTVMYGALDLAANELPAEGRVSRFVRQARGAALEGGELARQLVSLSRGSKAAAGPIEPLEVIIEAEQLARRLLRPGMSFRSQIEEDLPSVHITPNDLKHILLNLVSYARVVCPQEGEITVSATKHGTTGALHICVGHSGRNVPQMPLQADLYGLDQIQDDRHLGLAATARIVRANKGTIAWSQPCALSVHLPPCAKETRNDSAKS